MHIVKTNQLQANGVQKQGLWSHNITHYLQLLGASPQIPTGALPLDPAGGLPSPRPPGLPLHPLSLNSRLPTVIG